MGVAMLNTRQPSVLLPWGETGCMSSGYWSAPSCSSLGTQLCSSFLVQPVQDSHLQNVRISVIPSLVPHLSLSPVSASSSWGVTYLVFHDMLSFLNCSVFISLPEDFVAYLNSDGLILPEKWVALSPSLSCAKNHPSPCFALTSLFM